MQSQLRSVAAICAAAITLMACSDRPASTPTSPVTTRPNASVTATGLTTLTCDINALKSDAREYAKSGGDQLFKIIGDLQTAVNTGPVTATDKAFDGLARMAAIRGTGDQKAGVAGAVFNRLVQRFLGCADPAIAAGADAQTFGGALGAGWVFEVRGKATGQYADPAGGAYERGSTSGNWWAAEAAGTWADAIGTSTLTGDRVLIYGYRTTDFLNVSGRFGGSSFEHRTIPKIAAGTFALSVNVGLCVPDGTGITSTQRLNHNNQLVPLSTLTCATPTGFTATTGSLALGLAKRAWGFLAPQPAYAAFAVGSVGGAVSELSPSAVYNLGSVSLGDLGTIVDGRNTTVLATSASVPGYGKSVIIRAKDGTTPLQGVPIEMSIAGNNSSIAFFNVNNASTNVATVTRTTDVNGYASFGDVKLVKAGGYILDFRVNFDGVTGAATPSNSFNIQNK
jgi:hypothetical protein